MYHNALGAPHATTLSLLGLQLTLECCTHVSSGEGFWDFFDLRVEGRGTLTLPDAKVRAIVQAATGQSFNFGSPAALEAVAAPFRAPLIVTRHTGLVDYLRRAFPEAEAYEVSPHAKADDVRGRGVIGVLPAHLAALTLAHVEIPLYMSLVQRGAELDADEVARIAGPPRIYSVSGL
jgi:hypothetical protein